MTDMYAYASQPHYGAHIRPVVETLRQRGWDIELLQPGRSAPIGAHVIVASGTDVATLAGRKLVYLEHGAGQTYLGQHRGYAGGTGHHDCVLFLCPNETVANKWRDAYPDTPAVAVGCPMLDRWHIEPPEPDGVRVAFTFHWPSRLTPETGTAYPLYAARIREEVTRLCLLNGWGLVGHWHPKWGDQIRAAYDSQNIPTATYNDVMETATLLVADNTSMLPEFASTGRPVLWLNSPEWRRDVDHGGRFWEWPRGQVQCDSPFDLADRIVDAVADPPGVKAARAAMVANVYAATDGTSAAAAADAIETVVPR